MTTDKILEELVIELKSINESVDGAPLEVKKVLMEEAIEEYNLHHHSNFNSRVISHFINS
jgi:hypothetical protein